MSSYDPQSQDEDGVVDAVAAITITVVIVAAMVFWLAGMPT